MKSLLIAVALLAGCSKSKPQEKVETSPPVSGSGSAPTGSGSAGSGSAGSGSAAPAPIPPYTPAATVPDPIKAAIAATDRSDDDRRLDAG